MWVQKRLSCYLTGLIYESEVEANVVFLLVVLGPGLGLGVLTEEENESLD